LRSVDIADVIAGRPEEEALEVLRTLTAPLQPFKVCLDYVIQLDEGAVNHCSHSRCYVRLPEIGACSVITLSRLPWCWTKIDFLSVILAC
jgi:hypothetical protein